MAVDVAIDGAGETCSSRSQLAEVPEEDEFIIGSVYYNRVRGNGVMLL